ncbi:DUF4055 domain-containing protein [bacterium]|nr:DUF4055 domain-containing protein [bacterium]
MHDRVAVNDGLREKACYNGSMPVNSTHLEYEEALPKWNRARDVIAGEDAVKAAGVRYLSRLDSQSDEEYLAYKSRASFFNATARTAEGYLGLVFRRPPFIKRPESNTGNPHPGPLPQTGRGGNAMPSLARALDEFVNDADMLGNPLPAYAKSVVSEIISVGRAGTLIDWEDTSENRVYASLYRAEQIINWRVERINGRNVATMVVLFEEADGSSQIGDGDADDFATNVTEQIRVLRLVPAVASGGTPDATRGTRVVPGKRDYECVVEIWKKENEKSGRQRSGALPSKEKAKWKLVETRVPKRLGKPLPMIPFVFHGARHSLPSIEKLPMADIIAVNLDHYRLDADYKHGVHFTALPTAWVSGFDKSASLRIGASTAWVTDTPGATAGFLEFTGQGLTTFERAMDRDERLMAVLGSRLLEDQKKVGETATAIELRQSGENSILGNIAINVSASLTQVLRWAYWWNSTEELPDDITNDQVLIELNTDFSTKGLASQDIQAIVAAWQAGAISRDTMTELFRRGEVLPEGRTMEEELKLIGEQKPEAGSQKPESKTQTPGAPPRR